MGWFSNDNEDKNKNDGINQNLNKVTAEIKNIIQVKNDMVIILLIVINIAAFSFIWYMNSLQQKSLKKRYTAPRPNLNNWKNSKVWKFGGRNKQLHKNRTIQEKERRKRTSNRKQMMGKQEKHWKKKNSTKLSAK